MSVMEYTTLSELNPDDTMCDRTATAMTNTDTATTARSPNCDSAKSASSTSEVCESEEAFRTSSLKSQEAACTTADERTRSALECKVASWSSSRTGEMRRRKYFIPEGPRVWDYYGRPDVCPVDITEHPIPVTPSGAQEPPSQNFDGFHYYDMQLEPATKSARIVSDPTFDMDVLIEGPLQKAVLPGKWVWRYFVLTDMDLLVYQDEEHFRCLPERPLDYLLIDDFDVVRDLHSPEVIVLAAMGSEDALMRVRAGSGRNAQAEFISNGLWLWSFAKAAERRWLDREGDSTSCSCIRGLLRAL